MADAADAEDEPVDGPADGAETAPDDAGDPTDTDGEREESTTGATAPLVFLFGVLLFFGGTVAFVADLLTRHDVLRSLVVNATGAFVLVGWAAQDTLRDPESAVDSRGGATGTALLLYGVYLVVVGVVVAATSIWHDRLRLALLCGGSAVVAVAVGFVIFPTEAVVEQADDAGNETDDADDGADGTGDDGAGPSDETGGAGDDGAGPSDGADDGTDDRSANGTDDRESEERSDGT